MKLIQIDKDWLEQKYIKEKLSTVKIAKIYKIHNSTIGKKLKKFNIKRPIPLYKNQDWMKQKYIKESLSMEKIAILCGVGRSTIFRWIKKHEIELRKGRSMKGKNNPMWGRLHTAKTKKKLCEVSKDKIKSKETREKLSKALKGRKFSEEHKRKIGKRHKGKILSVETKKKIGQTMIKRGVAKGKNNPMFNIHLTGNKNPRWLGGKSFEPYGVEFNNELRKFIRKRDNYQCQICEIIENGRDHHCHHKDYDKKNNRPENLVTLCPPCHTKTNSNREYWQNYFKELN